MQRGWRSKWWGPLVVDTTLLKRQIIEELLVKIGDQVNRCKSKSLIELKNIVVLEVILISID